MPGDGETESTRSSEPRTVDNAGPAGRVFISYASHDDVVAARICSALEVAGFPCWIAPRDVRPGEPYAAAIVEAINACRMVVLVLTKSAIESPHVLREVERASSKKRSILSIRLDAAHLPPELEYFLSANHWLEAHSGMIESVLPALIESVRGRDTGNTVRAPSRARSAGAAQPAVGTMGGRRINRSLVAISAVVATALAYFVVDKIWLTTHATTPITNAVNNEHH